MIQLDDKRWKDFNGGYRIPYDASIPLKSLEKASTTEEIDAIFSEMWNELHHQGDVGIASYLSVPHLIRIAKEKKLFNFNLFGLIATIEIERHNDNPPLPKEFETEYFQALREGIPELVMMGTGTHWDLVLTSTILSALAVSKGHINLANAIGRMDDPDIITEILDKF